MHMQMAMSRYNCRKWKDFQSLLCF